MINDKQEAHNHNSATQARKYRVNRTCFPFQTRAFRARALAAQMLVRYGSSVQRCFQQTALKVPVTGRETISVKRDGDR